MVRPLVIHPPAHYACPVAVKREIKVHARFCRGVTGYGICSTGCCTIALELQSGVAVLARTAHSCSLNKLSKQLESATVGGFKQQAFGVLLVIYGAAISVFA